jgi:hypothetical protein
MSKLWKFGIVMTLGLSSLATPTVADKYTYERSFQPYDHERRYVCDDNSVEVFGDFSEVEDLVFNTKGQIEILFSVNQQAMLVRKEPEVTQLQPMFFDIKADNDEVLWLWPPKEAEIEPESRRVFHVKLFKQRKKRNMLLILTVKDIDMFVSYT